MIITNGGTFYSEASYRSHFAKKAKAHVQARKSALSRSRIASRSATNPGLFARDIVLTPLGEDPAGYAALFAELSRQLTPANLIERHYIEKIAAASWRLRRLMLGRDVPRLFDGRARDSDTDWDVARTAREKRTFSPLPPDLDPATLDNINQADADESQICQNEPSAPLPPPELGAGVPPNPPVSGGPCERGTSEQGGGVEGGGSQCGSSPGPRSPITGYNGTINPEPAGRKHHARTERRPTGL